MSISYEAYVSFIPLAKRKELDKKLDYQHGGVDKHLYIIAAELLEWKDLIPHLDLKKIDKRDILLVQNPSQQRVEVLEKWKSKLGFKATYGRLLKACSDGRCEMAAEKIVTLLGGEVTPAVPDTPSPPHSEGLTMATTAALPSAVVENFSVSMTPERLHGWLKSKQMPPDDCQIIKQKGVGGAVFLLINENTWTSFGISPVGMILLSVLKAEIQASTSHAIPTAGQIPGQPVETQPPVASSHVVPTTPKQILSEVSTPASSTQTTISNPKIITSSGHFQNLSVEKLPPVTSNFECPTPPQDKFTQASSEALPSALSSRPNPIVRPTGQRQHQTSGSKSLRIQGIRKGNLPSDYIFKPLSADSDYKFSFSLLKLEEVRAAKITGDKIRLAIIEENYNSEHTSLAGLNLPDRGYNSEDDSFDHGTAVVAIAAGKECTLTEGNKSLTYPGGVAQGATVEVFSTIREDPSSLLTVLTAIASGPKFDVVSISFGFAKEPEELTAELRKKVDDLIINGTIIFAAAGNDGDRCPVRYPACLPNVLSVASLTHGAGLSENARTKDVDIYCYGDEIVAPCGSGEELGKVSGSSMATPAVAGLACLALECAQKQGYNGQFYVDRIKKVINLIMRDGQEENTLNLELFLLRVKTKFKEQNK